MFEYPAKLLIVDDEEPIRKLLTNYLSNNNKYIIDSAEDGHNALKKLNSDCYDLVITDLRMPKMGGRELLQIMSEEFPSIPKIVLTAHVTDDDIIIALKTGAYDFLSKPIVDFTILEHSVKRAVEKKRLNDEKNRYVEQLKQINEIISMLNSGENTKNIFYTLNQILKKTIPFNRLSLATIDRETNNLSTKLVESDRITYINQGDNFNLSDSSLLDVAKDKNVLNINNLQEYLNIHPESISTQKLINEGMKSSMVLPLIVNNETRGFLIFASEREDAFKDTHITFLKSIVGQISLSIQRGELLYEIEKHTKNLEEKIEIRTRQVLNTQKTTIFALSKLAETRDPETGDHLERIRNYSILLCQMLKYIGKNYEITNQYLKDLYDSSILHDIGKVGIPDIILLKDGFLTDYEYEIMKKHTIIGYDALTSASKDLGNNTFLKMAMDITLHHHERWDGKGYPKGLKENEIPLAARIVTIADIYDALTTKRPYKEEYSQSKAIDIIKNEHFRFDPIIFKLFCENSEEFDKIRTKYSDETKANIKLRF